MKNNGGFTLLELSIVVMIIGLIMGGILVAQDLLNAAQMRATITKLEKINTAITTFKMKYNALPGDMLSSDAAAFGFFAITGANAGAVGYGDGDSIIQDAAGMGALNAEPLLIWRHLSDAGLIEGGFGADLTVTNGTSPTAITRGDAMGRYVPPAALTSNYFVIGTGNAKVGGTNTSISISGISFMTGAGPQADTLYTNALTPVNAYNLDMKIDDGNAMTGNARAWYMTNGYYGVPATVAQGCIDAANNYILTSSSKVCQLRMRAF